MLGRALLHDAASPEAFGLIGDWFQTCLTGHAACRVLFSSPGNSASEDVSPLLPTRVLDVGPPGGSQEPRLYVSNGTRASYVALSHCWGKHQILTTRTDNIQEHCRTISSSSLSKTFQDAVIITQRLGLRYVWIDSLCIVQDDAEDWRRESVKMGRIYQDAAITIAATGAKDGTVGCFIPRPLPPKQVALPYRVNEGPTPDEYIYITLFPNREVTSLESLEAAPLGGRAWITQEWMLSRRTIHYTPARMIWTCRTVLECEDGGSEAQMDEQMLLVSVKRYKDNKGKPQGELVPSDWEDMVGFFADWCELVSTYTSRDLTYESDKPAAIIGLAREIEQGIGEVYSAGIYYPSPPTGETTDELMTVQHRFLLLQLSWFGKSGLTRPPVLQKQPSWSWLSTTGAVRFHAPSQTAKPLARSIQIVEQKLSAAADSQLSAPVHLSLEARVKILDTANCRFTASFIGLHTKPPSVVQIFNFHSRSTFTTRAANIPYKLFYIEDLDSNALGWVSFDLCVLPGVDLHIVRLSSNHIDGTFDGFNVMFLAACDSKADQQGPRKFTRLGMGEILSSEWYDAVELEEIVVL